MPRTARLSITKLVDLFALQLRVQECPDEKTYRAAANRRDWALRRLTLRERLQAKLAAANSVSDPDSVKWEASPFHPFHAPDRGGLFLSHRRCRRLRRQCF